MSRPAPLWAQLERATGERDTCRHALIEAIERLNMYLQASEGAPEPSELETKQLVMRLQDVLDVT